VPLAWDELTYHLFYPAVWIRTGHVFLVDGVYPYNYLAFYPKNHELICTFSMVIVRNDVFVKLLNFPLVILTGVAAGRLCIQFGGSRKAGWCTGLFVATVPAMFCWVATTYVEPLLNFALLTAVSFLARAFTGDRRQSWRCCLLAGLALGLAAGTKYSALYLVVLLALLVLAVPFVQRLRFLPAARVVAVFSAGLLLTGVWWYACNAVVTGNPVYPVALGSLNAIEDPDRPGVHDGNILTEFASLWEAGYLPLAWFGKPAPTNLPWAVGPQMNYPTQLGFGIKFLVIVPLFLAGLLFAIWRTIRFVRDRNWAGAMATITIAASTLALLYTYLKLPLWDDPTNIFWQLRFAMPFVCLAIAMGFAALSGGPLGRLLPAVTVVGLVCDALILDLRFPDQDRLQSALILAMLAAAVYLLRNFRPQPRVAWRFAMLIVIVGLFPLLAHREKFRHLQWASHFEVHGSLGPAFAEAAYISETNYPGQTVAYAGNFASFLYMFTGPRFDHDVCYVSTHAGTALSHENKGMLRDHFDRYAWETNLKSSGARLLVCFRFCDRQLKSSYQWSPEDEWAKDLGFPVLVENHYCRLYEVIFCGNSEQTGQTAATRQFE
jgi:4-amino-4-deoxy-L-arabinose transferase-like glycosyltransferase